MFSIIDIWILLIVFVAVLLCLLDLRAVDFDDHSLELQNRGLVTKAQIVNKHMQFVPITMRPVTVPAYHSESPTFVLTYEFFVGHGTATERSIRQPMIVSSADYERLQTGDWVKAVYLLENPETCALLM